MRRGPCAVSPQYAQRSSILRRAARSLRAQRRSSAAAPAVPQRDPLAGRRLSFGGSNVRGNEPAAGRALSMTFQATTGGHRATARHMGCPHPSRPGRAPPPTTAPALDCHLLRHHCAAARGLPARLVLRKPDVRRFQRSLDEDVVPVPGHVLWLGVRVLRRVVRDVLEDHSHLTVVPAAR